MTTIFPVPAADFFDVIGNSTVTMDISDPRSSGETGGGEIITMNVGSRLWFGSVTVIPRYSIAADEMALRAAMQKQAGASFLVTDGRRNGPRNDPDGAILGAATPTISAVSSDNCEMDITGLPAAYKLGWGDLLSFEYSTGPKYALHRVVGDHTANGAGNMSDVEVYPPIKAGAVGSSIKLVKPECKATLVTESFQVQTQRPVITSGFSFSWRQTHS